MKDGSMPSMMAFCALDVGNDIAPCVPFVDFMFLSLRFSSFLFPQPEFLVFSQISFTAIVDYPYSAFVQSQRSPINPVLTVLVGTRCRV